MQKTGDTNAAVAASLRVRIEMIICTRWTPVSSMQYPSVVWPCACSVVVDLVMAAGGGGKRPRRRYLVARRRNTPMDLIDFF